MRPSGAFSIPASCRRPSSSSIILRAFVPFDVYDTGKSNKSSFLPAAFLAPPQKPRPATKVRCRSQTSFPWRLCVQRPKIPLRNLACRRDEKTATRINPIYLVVLSTILLEAEAKEAGGASLQEEEM
jgi:hypothetical protein